MRKILFILVILFSSIAAFSQAPTQFKYQGVARDANNQPFTNASLGIKFSIIRDSGNGSGSGPVQYIEKHQVSTSPMGVFVLNIGDGETTFGDIEAINWGNAEYWLKVEMDVSGGEDYVFMGNTPILPVPLAMHAMTVEDKDDADADPQNEIQNLSYNPNTSTLSLTNGGQVDLSSLQGGGGGNDDQTLSLNGMTLSIENGNQIDLSSIQDGTEDADANPQNEIQTIGLSGNNLTLSNGGGQVDLSGLAGGGGSDNQTLQLNGTNLVIENGNQIDLAVIQDGTEDADANPENELQTISFDPNTNELSISEGNTISIPAGQADADADPGNEIQTISFDPNTNELSISEGNTVNIPVGQADADADPENEIQTIELDGDNLILTNGGGQVDLGGLAGGGGDDDQTLQLNGTNLAIENGNQIDLSVIQDGTEDADANPENELQTISFDPNTNELSISEGNTISIPAGQADADADPQNEIQTIELDGNNLTLSNGGGQVDLSGLAGGGGSDDQNLQLNDTNLSIENGNQIDLAIIQDGTEDADADPGNELQNLQLNGTNLSIENGNQINLAVIQDGTEDADANPENELQTIQLNGNNLVLSNGGGQVNLGGIAGDDNQNLQLNGTNLSIENGNQINLAVLQDGTQDADANPQNELQTIQLNGNNLILSNGGGQVNLGGIAGDDNQVLQLNGTNLSIENGNQINLAVIQDGTQDADANPQNELQTIQLNGDNLVLSDGGGQVDLGGLIGGSSLWQQNASGDLFTDEKIAIGFDESELSHLEVKKDITIYNTARRITVDMFSNSAGGNINLKAGILSNYNTAILRGDVTDGGELLLFNKDGDEQVKLASDDVLGGILQLSNPNESVNFSCAVSNNFTTMDMKKPSGGNGISNTIVNTGGISYYYGMNNGPILVSTGADIANGLRGKIQVGDNSSLKLLALTTKLGDAAGKTSGVIEGFNSDNDKMFSLGAVGDNQNRGSFSLYSPSSYAAIYMTGKYGGEIALQSGSSGVSDRNVTIGAVSGNNHKGKVTVHNTLGTTKAGMYINGSNDGVLFADIKNFRIDHPTDDTKEIWYACVEGPEAAAYERGTTTLTNGEAIITFPKHFELVANHETMTVMLTPLSADCKGLAVIEKTATGFKVKELFQGTGTYQFDWEVKCVRKGYEDYKAVREKKDFR